MPPWPQHLCFSLLGHNTLDHDTLEWTWAGEQKVHVGSNFWWRKIWKPGWPYFSPVIHLSQRFWILDREAVKMFSCFNFSHPNASENVEVPSRRPKSRQGLGTVNCVVCAFPSFHCPALILSHLNLEKRSSWRCCFTQRQASLLWGPEASTDCLIQGLGWICGPLWNPTNHQTKCRHRGYTLFCH